MKKKFRIKKNQEFQKILNKRQFVITKSFTIYYIPKGLDIVRIGISVSKKLGNAVVRNKVKRQVRMMCQNEIDFSGKYDLIILVRRSYLTNSFQENQEQLSNLLSKIKIRRK